MMQDVVTTHDDMSTHDGMTIEKTTAEEVQPTDSSSGSSSTGGFLPILAVLYMTISILGLAGNTLVIVVFWRSKKLKKRLGNYFVFSQSCADLFSAVILFFMTIFLIEETPMQGGIRGQLRCYLWETNVFFWAASVVSVFNLVAISVEMYLEIVFPLYHIATVNKKRIYLTIGVMILVGVAGYGAFIFPTTKLEDGACLTVSVWPSQTLKSTIGILLIVIQYFLPLAVLVYVYGHIGYTLQRRARQIDPGAQGGGGGDSQQEAPQDTSTSTNTSTRADKISRAKKNLLKTFLGVTIMFVICWTTNQVIFVMFNLGYELDFESTLYHTSVVLIFFNCAVNPLVYITKYEQFRNEMQRQLNWHFRRTGDSASVTNTSATTDT